MRQTLLIAMTALLLAAPASAAHKPKHPKHHKKHAKVTHVSKLVNRASDFSGTAAGTLVALSASSLTVRSDDRGVNCTLGDGSPRLGDFHVGDKVKVTCTNGVLNTIARLAPPPPPVETQTATGTLTALSDAAVTVHTERGDVTCTRGSGSPKLGDFHLGDVVKAACANGVLTVLAHVDLYTGGTGTLTALSPASLTVHTDGGDVTCNLTGDSPIPTQFHVGDSVKMSCKNGLAYSVTKPT
jgi:hypothetical protein